VDGMLLEGVAVVLVALTGMYGEHGTRWPPFEIEVEATVEFVVGPRIED